MCIRDRSKTINRASGYFAFFVFGSKTVVGDVVEKSIVTAFVFALDILLIFLNFSFFSSLWRPDHVAVFRLDDKTTG